MAVQQYCVCHHCSDGHASKEKLAFMVGKYHKECQTCTEDERCPAELALDVEKKDAFKDLRTAVDDYLIHKDIADHQAAAMRMAKEQLSEGECLVIEDFAGRFLVKADLELSQNDYFARFGVPDLVVCVYFKEKGDTKCEIFNFLANTKEKEDFYFLREAWVALLDTPLMKRFRNIKIFSDGGPKHFKIRKSLFLFSLLQDAYPQNFQWNFFQSCHGKGPCDSHAGMLKNLLKKEVLRGEIIHDEEELYDLFKAKAKAHTIMLDITRQEVDCAEFKQGIKKFFCFEYCGEGKVKCFQKTGDEKFVLQTITSKYAEFLPYHDSQAHRALPMDLSS